MLVGVISDTHWTRPGQYLDAIDAHFAGVDHILHAGDVVAPCVLERLRRLAPVTAVRGNCDSWNLDLPGLEVVSFEAVRVGIFHGYEVDLRRPLDILETFPDDVSLIIHGHTHVPANYRHQEVTIFNPGSPGQPRQGPDGSVGLLRIQGDRFSLEHRIL